ncbi:MAG: alanyl-tRNA editing protein AlaX [Candidatus Nanoclepta minutus]|uniref:Alanyl-tRNA editing protein AlaX n=1 Tax=Candidatus Nanoclepta minutus TaxID=1940235 RepID=A0A397WMY4_9ARCH|nr:MAG: alanyl-tRNA editing protein AlaX [Candidatus Nanoclepta minutus]
MMTKYLYWYDSYIKEFEARVVRVEGNRVVLDQTIFHPRTGGVDCDTGKLIFNDEEYFVKEVIKDGEEALHVLDREPKFREGDVVKGMIDWDRRYRLMKLHTAAHILSAVLYNRYNILITGGEITPEYARDDYSLSSDNWRNILEEAVIETNKIIERGVPVKVYFLSREEAMKIPGIVKLMEKSPPNVREWRIVEIEGIDLQADGGPHVSNTREIGGIKVLKLENRGKNNKRIYYTLR